MDDPAEEEEETGPTINEDHYVIGYGPKTIEAIMSAVSQSFKLFWDGSVSMFMETALSSSNNKDVLKVLLELRRKTQNLEEPPVTFMHGIESEVLLRHTLMQLKEDEQRAFEAKQRAAQDKPEDEENEEEEEEEDMGIDGDESEEKLTTF